MDKKITLLNCTFVKTILMLTVILGHSTAFWADDWFTAREPVFAADWLGIFSNWLGSFHIYAFVLVSGYIFAYKMSGGGYASYGRFLKNKAKRLLIPYVFTAGVWVVPLSQYFYKWDVEEIIQKYVLCINPSQLWFLWMLFWVFALVWPLWKLLSGSMIKGLIIALVCYAVGLVGGYFVPNIYCIWTAFQYIPFFFIGIQIRVQCSEEVEDKLKDIDCRGSNVFSIEKIPAVLWVTLDLLIFYIDWLAGQGRISIPGVSLITGFILHIIGAVMAFAVLQKTAGKFTWQENKGFSKLIKCSMPMYLFHQQIIYFVIAELNGRVNSYINATLNFVLSTIISLLISIILLRFKYTRVLAGEKWKA